MFGPSRKKADFESTFKRPIIRPTAVNVENPNSMPKFQAINNSTFIMCLIILICEIRRNLITNTFKVTKTEQPCLRVVSLQSFIQSIEESKMREEKENKGPSSKKGQHY